MNFHDITSKSFLLIVSGADRVGKDWLAEKLHKKLYATWTTLMKPMHVFKLDFDLKGNPDDVWTHSRWLDQWHVQMRLLLEQYKVASSIEPQRLIVDRLFQDEWAYARAMGRISYGDWQFAQLDQAYADAGARWLLCIEDMDVIQSRWDDAPAKLELMKEVQANFKLWTRHTKLKTMVVNTQQEGVVDAVASWLLRREDCGTQANTEVSARS